MRELKPHHDLTTRQSSTTASSAASASELVVVRDMHGLIMSARIALAGVTVAFGAPGSISAFLRDPM